MEKLQVNKIYNTDFREAFKNYDLSNVNLIATDPPYNINFNYNNYKDNLGGVEYISLLSNFKNFPTAIIHYPEEMMKYVVHALGVPNEVCAWC